MPRNDLATAYYPGSDDVGAVWERPPIGVLSESQRRPVLADAATLIGIAGPGGHTESFKAGAWDRLEENFNFVHMNAASAGNVSAFAWAGRMPSEWRQRQNAGAPWHKMLKRAEGLGPFARRNLDLAGIYELTELMHWHQRWLEWTGIKTWDDVKYKDGEPHPQGATHKVSTCVVVWRARPPERRRYTEEELADPEFIHKLFRKKYFSPRSFPLRAFSEVWLPDQHEAFRDVIGLDHINERSPAETTMWSSLLWPVLVPKVGQDMHTLELVFVADGGHIHNQPHRWNIGYAPPDLVDASGVHDALPMVDLHSKEKASPRKRSAQLHADRMAVPFGLVVRSPRLGEAGVGGLREMQNMVMNDRLHMYAEGSDWAGDVAVPRIEEYLTVFPKMLAVARERHGGFVAPVEPLHAFRAVAAEKVPGVRADYLQLNW